MKIVQNESDFAKLRMEGNIDKAVINYIETYFKQFATKTEHGLSIQEVGMIVILEQGDHDMGSPEMLLPSIFRSIPEETKLIHINTPDSAVIELFQSLFLPSNEMGIDLFCLKDGVSREIQDRLMDELESNGDDENG